jgi:DNA repair protein RecN (Recombination protein N)
MLLTLRIRNLVIVEDLSVDFDQGLNVLTGETGGGKSILVSALGLLAGARADRSMVRAGERRATVEALFDADDAGTVDAWLRDHGMDGVEDGEPLLVHREISPIGSGRVLINGSPATVALLRELGRDLLELHGQNEQQGLLAPERHLELLDLFCDATKQLDRVRATHSAVLEARKRLTRLHEQSAKRIERRGELQHIVADIDAVRPKAGELEQLDRDRRVLRSAGTMAALLDEVVELGYEGDRNASALAAIAAGKCEQLAELDPALDDAARRLREAALELQDVGSFVREYRDHADFDPSRLEAIEERLVALERLCLRYGKDEAELISFRDEAQQALSDLLGADGEMARAAERLVLLESDYLRAATALTRRRRSGARTLAKAVEGQMAELALEQARFEVALQPANGDLIRQEGADELPLNPRGAERAEFLLAANPGEPFRPLQQVASGGELSRVMLALHVVADRPAPAGVLVFDEVDTGVSGAVADAVGARLAALAKRQQVLCVTHLPQVAAHGRSHFRVAKTSDAGRTKTSVESLGDAERVEELARMLAGRRPTASSRKNAAELLATASGIASGRRRREA